MPAAGQLAGRRHNPSWAEPEKLQGPKGLNQKLLRPKIKRQGQAPKVPNQALPCEASDMPRQNKNVNCFAIFCFFCLFKRSNLFGRGLRPRTSQKEEASLRPRRGRTRGLPNCPKGNNQQPSDMAALKNNLKWKIINKFFREVMHERNAHNFPLDLTLSRSHLVNCFHTLNKKF